MSDPILNAAFSAQVFWTLHCTVYHRVVRYHSDSLNRKGSLSNCLGGLGLELVKRKTKIGKLHLDSIENGLNICNFQLYVSKSS